MPTKTNRWGLLGTGIHHGQPKSGVEKGLQALHHHGVFDRLLKDGAKITDYGDLAENASSTPYTFLFDKVTELLTKPETPLWIGGDHSQAFATISALVNTHPNLRVVWVDAHGDINTPTTSPTGNLHGMPLAGLLGLASKESFQMPWLNQNLIPEQVALVGIRDLDENEMELIRSKGVLHFSAKDVQGMGMETVFRKIQESWEPSGPVHLSFDIDGLDSSLVPATGTPVASGLTLQDMDTLIAGIQSEFNMVSCEIVELNPELAKNQHELERTIKTVEQLLRRIVLSPYF